MEEKQKELSISKSNLSNKHLAVSTITFEMFPRLLYYFKQYFSQILHVLVQFIFYTFIHNKTV